MDKKENQVMMMDGKVVTLALFEPRDYCDLKNGKAVDNNGIRSRKGNYLSRQPQHIDVPQEIIAAYHTSISASDNYAQCMGSEQNVHSQNKTRAPGAAKTHEERIVEKLLKQYIIAPVIRNVSKKYVVPVLTDKIGGLIHRIATTDCSPNLSTKAQEIVRYAEMNNSNKRENQVQEPEQLSDKIIRFPA